MLHRTNKLIHFSGVHRSGKTTDATQYAKDNDFILILTDFSNITKVKGFDNNPSEEKQVALMDHMLSIYLGTLRRRTKKHFVLDRSMLDIVAYSLYYNFSKEHIKYLWYRVEDTYNLLFTNNNIPIHEHNYDYPLTELAKPSEAKDYKRLLDMFNIVREAFYIYAKKKNYYL